MLSRREYQCIEAGEAVWNIESMPEIDTSTDPATRFYGQFADCMEMCICSNRC